MFRERSPCTSEQVLHARRQGDTFERGMAAPLSYEMKPPSEKTLMRSFPLITGSPGDGTCLELR